jgi:nucleoside-diphosphate-sugar epimerase
LSRRRAKELVGGARHCHRDAQSSRARRLPVIEEAPLRSEPITASRDDVCLITGATGFIGGHLVQRLVEDGYRVRCLARSSSDTSRLDALGVDIVVGDLASAPSLAVAAAGCRYVFHCGALVSDWATVAEIRRVNVEGTRNLLAAALNAAVETYVARRFRNWYAQTKLAGEADVRRASEGHKLEAVILRPATVYGPGSKDVIGEIARALRNGTMLLIARGRAIAGLCYVENLIDAAVLALTSKSASGQAFTISDGLQVTWKGLTDDLSAGLGCSPARWSLPYSVANAIGFSLEHGYRALRRTTHLRTPPLLSRQAVQVLGTNQDFSNRKARELLGWEPQIDYATGLDATIAWLLAEHL